MKKMKLQSPTLGFLASGWCGGISSPNFLFNVPDEVCSLTDIINEFLVTSPIPSYNSYLHRGVWRYITVRLSHRTRECMIIIVHAPPSGAAGAREDGSDNYTKIFEHEKYKLVSMLQDLEFNRVKCKRKFSYSNNGECIINDENSGPNLEMTVKNSNDDSGDLGNDSSNIRVTSIFFQEYAGLSSPSPSHPVQHVFGKKYLEEKLLNCTFRISPGAFFQVSTEGAELLYKVVIRKIKEVSFNAKVTALLDVCCGTGTIGLTCLKEEVVGSVIGIDFSKPAIRDAVANAKILGYGSDSSDENSMKPKQGASLTRFIASRAELAIYDEVKKINNNQIVAVVDPARDGVHNSVLKALRNEARIQRILYVSCNPTGSLVNDATLLCAPQTKKYYGLPFQPTSAQPVDMFPHTNHCEIVMVFDRMTHEQCNREKDKGSENN